MNYVIIGGGIAGTTAAETIRSIDVQGSITILSKEPYPLYSRITITNYAAGEVEKERLFIRHPQQYLDKNIQLIESATATSIDTENKQVTYSNVDGQSTQIAYDRLLIATGGMTNKIDLPGSDGNGIFYIYDIDDATKIMEYTKGKKHAVVSGGAFIGIDFVTIFQTLGLSIDFLIRGDRFLHSLLDEQASTLIQDYLTNKGVSIRTEEEIQEFLLDENRNVVGVKTNKVANQACDVVGLGLGINRITPLIAAIPLKKNKGVVTNEYLQTSDPNIYAAGDIAEYYDVHTKEYATNGDWASARLQGIVAGKNLAGQPTAFNEVPSNTINILGKNATVIGCVDPDLQTQVKDNEKSYIKVFMRDGVIIGGIVIGDNIHALKIKTAIKEKKGINDIDIS